MPVDFNAIIAEARKKGAFNDYPQPLNETSRGVEAIRYPGQLAYGNGPMAVEWSGIPLSQKTVDAQQQSFRTIINHLAPSGALDKFMRDYFSEEFLGKKYFMESLATFQEMEYGGNEKFGDKCASAAVTRRLDKDADEERLRHPRRPFAREEYAIASAICRKHPELAASIIAFHSAFMNHLRSAIQEGNLLDEREKSRALEQMVTLREASRASLNSMIDGFMPAIALQYDGRVRQKHEEPLSDSDYRNGMQWVQHLKLFDHPVAAGNGKTLSFRCAAEGMLMRASALDLEATADALPDYAQKHYGRLLAGIARKIGIEAGAHPKALKSIYRAIEEKCTPESPAAARSWR